MSKTVQFIKENKHLPDERICHELGIDQKKLIAIRYWNGIKKEYDRSWTPDQVKYLKDWYGKKTNREIGEHIGRTRQAVADKLHHMKKKNQY